MGAMFDIANTMLAKGDGNVVVFVVCSVMQSKVKPPGVVWWFTYVETGRWHTGIVLRAASRCGDGYMERWLGRG